LRLDKFLKTSLIFKTRSSGEKAIEDGNVMINEKPSKPSANVKVGDFITVVEPLKKTKYKILLILEKNVSKKDAREMFEIVSEERFEL
jgi:ribosomal 50S subunit-recycling heat shock protein